MSTFLHKLILVILFKNSLCRMYFESIQFNVNPRYCTNVTVVVFNDTEGISRQNASGHLKVDILRGFVMGAVYGRAKHSQEYDQLIFKSHVDACNAKKGIIGNFVVQMVLTNLKKYSNIDVPCPLKKGFLYAANFPIGDTSMLPRGIMGLSGQWMAMGSIKAKIDKKKSMVQLGNFKLFGSIE